MKKALRNPIVLNYVLLVTLLARGAWAQAQCPSPSFRQVSSIPISGLGLLLGSGDFNSDGKTDLLWQIDANLYLAPGNGDGTFQSPRLISSEVPYYGQPAVADFNGDGKLDLVMFGTRASVLFLGNGDGTFVLGTLGVGAPTSDQHPIVADFDGDGKPDIASVSPLAPTQEVLVTFKPRVLRTRSVPNVGARTLRVRSRRGLTQLSDAEREPLIDADLR